MPDPERDEILEPELEPAERKRLLETARLLERARPIPRPSFRGELVRKLRARSAGSAGPQRVRLLVSAYAGAGLALLAVVAVGLGGVGPLAPG